MKEQDCKSKRRYFRVYFDQVPLESEIVIEKIKGTPVNTGRAFVETKDISAGGMCFKTDLKLPVRDDVEFGFFLVILNRNIKVSGRILRCNQVETGDFEYGVEFSFPDNSLQQQLIILLNQLSLRMRQGRLEYSQKGA